mgnify:FL=1
MKFKLLFPTLLLLFLSTTVFSQNRQRANRPAPQPVSESVENILETLTKKLELSEDQKESSEEILTTYFESLENLRE